MKDKAEEHKQRHIELHKALDELFADYINNNPNESTYTEMPLSKLLDWSHQQTINPSNLKDNG